jgi:hypothetical protein
MPDDTVSAFAIGASCPVSPGVEFVSWFTWLYRAWAWPFSLVVSAGSSHWKSRNAWPKIRWTMSISPGPR